ncbi:CBS domain-containing protein [Phocicoccus pinnipedialis]|uniref:CBS domain-containing protein n=1 Tax=Phocicoccus pinnipedialis TaxID=110845 RepID=A0A6V7R5V1_9BACL|nr:CBS domain-containing protein [Jeotgalicoccus pinnipedialis]MBP1939769.1 putative transcriptional regulator [Jeotgalicoccus pinnipedialis]CAD2072395.1 hypothetical protein JEOPIN946_00491 [Jeotgalicoccus pinnipedialis]
MNLLEEFLTEFNLLHEAMKKDAHRDQNFGKLMYYLKNRNPIVKQYYDDIDKARQLRNILVHEKKEKYNIAEPTEMFVERLRLIRSKFENPETVALFKRPITSLNNSDTFKKALNDMRQQQVSQYPVFEGNEFLGMLTDNGITKWLTLVSTETFIDLSTYQVRDLIQLDDKDTSYIIVDKNYPLHKVEEKMTELVNRKGYSKLSILITPKGHIKSRDDIIGIITPADMPRVLEYLK